MKTLLRGSAIAVLLALVASAVAEAVPGPMTPWTRPAAPDTAGAVQLGVESPLLPEGQVERAEMKLQHSCFQAPGRGSYSHSLVARTDRKVVAIPCDGALSFWRLTSTLPHVRPP